VPASQVGNRLTCDMVELTPPSEFSAVKLCCCPIYKSPIRNPHDTCLGSCLFSGWGGPASRSPLNLSFKPAALDYCRQYKVGPQEDIWTVGGKVRRSSIGQSLPELL
jgi:hypothetical protein